METKICTKCKRELSLDDFHWRNKKAGTKRSECKECHNKQVKERYSQNKDIINSLKEKQCCVKCGYNKCVAALDYHHTDETKKPLSRCSNIRRRKNMDDCLPKPPPQQSCATEAFPEYPKNYLGRNIDETRPAHTPPDLPRKPDMPTYEPGASDIC